jgi:hypothetical protein
MMASHLMLLTAVARQTPAAGENPGSAVPASDREWHRVCNPKVVLIRRSKRMCALRAGFTATPENHYLWFGFIWAF